MNRNHFYVVDIRRRTGSAVYRTRFEFVAKLACVILRNADYGKPGTFYTVGANH